MKKITFAQFEKATSLLENSIESIDDKTLLESGFTREDLLAINEGILGDIFGGLMGKLKEKILKKIPGSVLKKADAIIKDYRDTKVAISEKTQKERDKIYKANVDDKDNARNIEQVKRSEKAIEAIEAASKAKLDSIEKQLAMIKKDKSEVVTNYIDMQLLQVKEDIANKQMEAAEKNASPEELDRLEKEINEYKQKKAALAKAIEDSKVKEKEEADKKVKDEDDKKNKVKDEEFKKANDPNNAKKDQQWIYKNNNGEEVKVTIVDEKPVDGKIHVKAKQGPFLIKIDKLIKLA